MTDIVDPETRSAMMARIRGKNTRPELTLRKALFSHGFRYQLHNRELPGVPDLLMKGRRVAVFVHGCYWHQHSGCHWARVPKSRAEFWAPKLRSNATRDTRNIEQLKNMGWRVGVVWECALRPRWVGVTIGGLIAWIEQGGEFFETPVVRPREITLTY